MTLVVSTASAAGITVVGDRAVTRRSGANVDVYQAQKVWYAPGANVALAFWGNANLPGEEPLQYWASRFVSEIEGKDTVSAIAQRLVDRLKPELEKLSDRWSSMRRGIHVSGYEDGIPVILHVHTGEPKEFHHALEVHRDFPDIHGGGSEVYRRHIENGGNAQLRNGYHELFATISKFAMELQADLSSILRVRVPAATLRDQAAFDEALVRFSAGILKSAELPQSVSTKVDVIAFTQEGQAEIFCEPDA